MPSAAVERTRELVRNGDAARAGRILERHLASVPRDVEARLLLADIERRRGRMDAAETHYRRLLDAAPGHVAGLRGLGLVMAARENAGEALNHLHAAVGGDPDDPLTWNALADVLGLLTSLGTMPVEVAEELALGCLRSPAAGNKGLSAFLVRLFSRLPGWGELVRRGREGEPVGDLLDEAGIWAALSRPSAVLALQQVLLPDLDVEAALHAVRRAAVLGLARRPDHPAGAAPALLAALALHAHHTGYVAVVEDDELDALEGLVGQLEGRPPGDDPADAARVALVAAYMPLALWERAGDVVERIAEGWAPELAEVALRQIFEPMEEEQLKLEIPTLAMSDDETSQRVRELYEAHPYPRWHRLPPEGRVPFAQALQELFPRRAVGPDEIIEAPRILVAGCGSGSHPLGAAARYEGARVTGIDLSLASLAFAQRKASEMGADEVRFIQADILALGDWEIEGFDVVESSGVLHHLSDPERGWRELVRRLRPGGFMKIGLYSSRARLALARAREALQEIGWDGELESLPRARARLIAAMRGTEWGTSLAGYRDFYSLHEFRDLLLHPHEDLFTIPRIRAAVDRLGLEFIGFVGVPPSAMRRFARLTRTPGNGADLSAWEALEAEQPDTFKGMYQFWLRKPAA